MTYETAAPKAHNNAHNNDLPYVYFWHRQGRKGQPCKVTARGKMNSCRVEFADGYVMITSRNAIRRKAQPPCQQCGGGGYVYDCFDRGCIEPESGCDFCKSRCDDCNPPLTHTGC